MVDDIRRRKGGVIVSGEGQAAPDTETVVRSALLEGASIHRVIDLKVARADNELVLSAKVDLAPELTMREVSVVLHKAKRRVRAAVVEANAVYIEPDVWVDPNATAPSTSAIVTLAYD